MSVSPFLPPAPPGSALFLPLGLLLLTGYFTACSRQDAPASPAGRSPVVPVLTAPVAKKNVPLDLPAIGTVQPRATVTIRPQISGKLAEIHFREGDFVKAGDLLFSIDPRPFQVAFARAQAALDQANAEATNATARAARYARIERSGSVSGELIEQIRTASATTQAQVTAATAALQQAQLELDYCRISSPLSGRAGRLLLDPGNIVQANLTELAIINEIQPIEISFTLAGRHLPLLRQYTSPGSPPLQVTAIPEGSKTLTETGTFTFLDNTIRPASGTIEIRALFPNASAALWPGQFADVRLRLTETAGALTVPAKSIQSGQRGSFVFVIGPDLTAEIRPVKVGRMAAGEALIDEGLHEGERVVIDGQSLLRPKSKVELKDPPDKSAAPAPAPKPAAPAQP